MASVEPPEELGEAGRELWVAVTKPYVLTPAELSVLLEACRTADELVDLKLAVSGLSSLTTTGSTGQLKAHPLLAEVRSHRALLERLVGSLNIPADDDVAGKSRAARHAQGAAQGRWASRGDRRGGASTAS